MTHIFGNQIQQKQQTAVAIGNFDGLHLGHMKLLELAKSVAISNKLKSVVFSFYPHPLSVLTHAKVEPIFSSEEKSEIIRDYGIDVFIEYPFNNQTANMSPETFVRQILFEQLRCRYIIVGEEFSFGKAGKGNPDLLKQMGEQLGFNVRVVPHFKIDGRKVSSSDIRQLIKMGDFEQASLLLGRNYDRFFVK